MEIALDIRKNLNENAAYYFEKSKKAKKKLVGARNTVEQAMKRLESLEMDKEKEEYEAKERKENELKNPKPKKEWHENFRWFISSEGFLCIGGRDATTNDILVKKHLDKEDIVFHTEAPGSPFFIVKTLGKKPGDATLNEAAQATAAYSRSWRVGIGTAEVYWVNPDQISKTAAAGEHLAKGSFMVHGKRNYYNPRMEIAVGITKEGRIMGAPLSAVKQHCTAYVELVQGSEKASDLAKKIQKKIKADNVELDEIIKVIPSGGAQLKK